MASARETAERIVHQSLRKDGEVYALVGVALIEDIEFALAAERERAATLAEAWWINRSSFGSPEVERFKISSSEIAAAIRNDGLSTDSISGEIERDAARGLWNKPTAEDDDED